VDEPEKIFLPATAVRHQDRFRMTAKEEYKLITVQILSGWFVDDGYLTFSKAKPVFGLFFVKRAENAKYA